MHLKSPNQICATSYQLFQDFVGEIAVHTEGKKCESGLSTEAVADRLHSLWNNGYSL